MSAHISGKEVESAYIDGKEVLQIYDGGKLVWCKYFPIGYQIILGILGESDVHTSNYIVNLQNSEIISQTGSSTTFGDTATYSSYVDLDGKTFDKIPPNRNVTVAYRTSTINPWINKGTYPKSDFAAPLRINTDTDQATQIKLTVV